MNRSGSWRRRLAACATAFAAILAVAEASGVAQAGATAAQDSTVLTQSGVVRGVPVSNGYVFRGVPYAAPPTGQLRWQPPQPPAPWTGVRDAAAFAPTCPQQPGVPLATATSEDCLYLNVYTPAVRDSARPVLVWIHGGGLTQDSGNAYDATKLAAKGIVVVTLNYRLGALGFLAHPALAAYPGGPAGNYGFMDQQAALRWVRDNIDQFGGNPGQVAIAGESAGGLSVLAHLVSPGSRGLFRRAILESGAFALQQQPLAEAERAGESFATAVGCPDQSAVCLRQVPVATLTAKFPPAAIPGVVDGAVLRESVGAALAAGRFARVPLLNGTNHDEQRIFVVSHQAIAHGANVPAPTVTADNYQASISDVLGTSPAQTAAIAEQYPLAAYPSPEAAYSTLLGDAGFVCPAVQVDNWLAAKAPSYAYSFDDDTAPQIFTPDGYLPQIATHASEVQYLFDLPYVYFPHPLNAQQEALADTMRTAWARFAATGAPGTDATPWPSFADGGQALSLNLPQPSLRSGFADAHHCSLWATN